MLSMNSPKKVLTGIAALAALGLGGSAIAGAANTTNGDGDGEKADGPDQVLTGSAFQRAGAAATRAVGGGRVVSVESSDEGGPAVYEVKVDKAGTITEVQVSRDYAVTGQKADDDAAGSQDKGDGDGEHADDAAGKQDKGDGDGEHADD